MANLDPTMLNQIVAAVIQVLQVQGNAAPKATASAASPVDKLAQRDAAIRAGFARRGIKNVTLMDRNDKSKEHDVRPYKGWLELGYQVRRGQKSVKGLFHRSQVDPIAPKAQPKAKAAKPVQSKPGQLPLA